jgi:hypothetical protein
MKNKLPNLWQLRVFFHGSVLVLTGYQEDLRQMYDNWIQCKWKAESIQIYGDTSYRPWGVLGMQLAPYENLQEQAVEYQKEVVKYLKKQCEDGENWRGD